MQIDIETAEARSTSIDVYPTIDPMSFFLQKKTHF